MKKIFLMVSTILGILLLTACGGGKVDTTVNLDVDLNNKIELNAMFPNSGYSDTQFQTGKTTQFFEEITGYKVNYKQISDTNADVDVTNYLSSKEKLHVMKLAAGQYEAHVNNGAFVRLNELLDIYGKNLKEVISKESWDSVTDKNGNIYAIPETAFSAMQDSALVFNVKHLEAIGYNKTPETIGELTDVLEKLQSKFGNGNPNYHALGLAGSQADLTTISSAFELPLEFFVNAEGKIQNYIFSEAYDKYVTYMNGLVAKNILAQSWTTQLASDLMSNFTKENISVGFMNYWTIIPLYEQMAATSKYGSVEEAKNAVAWQLKIRGDGTNGSTLQTTAKYRAAKDNAYYITIPVYMGNEAAYAIDWMDKKITDEAYQTFYAGKENEAWAYTNQNDPEGIEIKLDNETKYYKLLPGFNDIKGNAMYATGANAKVGTAFWKLREAGFGAWTVTTELDETIITNPLSLRSTLQHWPKVSIAARSYIITLTQQAINSQREGSKSKDGIIQTLRTSFVSQYWSNAVDTEIQDWYKNK